MVCSYVEKLSKILCYNCQWQLGGGCKRIKVYVIVEDYEVGHRITSLNICNICSTVERANEKRDKLLKDYDSFCDEEYRKTDEYQYFREMFRVVEWEVEE